VASCHNTFNLSISTWNSCRYGYMFNSLLFTIIIKVFCRKCRSPICNYSLGTKITLCCVNLSITLDVSVDFVGYSQTNLVNASVIIKRQWYFFLVDGKAPKLSDIGALPLGLGQPSSFPVFLSANIQFMQFCTIFRAPLNR